MKKMCATIITILLIATSTIEAMPITSFSDGVEIKQDRSGRIGIKSTSELKQVKCFNEGGKKYILEIGKHKKNIKLADKLEKGIWYFQVKTANGESVFTKLEIA